MGLVRALKERGSERHLTVPRFLSLQQLLGMEQQSIFCTLMPTAAMCLLKAAGFTQQLLPITSL